MDCDGRFFDNYHGQIVKNENFMEEIAELKMTVCWLSTIRSR
jgi:hypothetical protein